jgi:hypothetical protein
MALALGLCPVAQATADDLTARHEEAERRAAQAELAAELARVQAEAAEAAANEAKARVEAAAAAKSRALTSLGLSLQRQFLQAVESAKVEYRSAANDFQKGAARADRAAALCTLLSGMSFDHWRGTVSVLSSNTAGDGVLAVELADDVVLTTTSGGTFDFTDTVIHRGSSLYGAIRVLSEGEAVEIAGSFLSSDDDCIKERSLTQYGSMTSPEFIVNFRSVVAVR